MIVAKTILEDMPECCPACMYFQKMFEYSRPVGLVEEGDYCDLQQDRYTKKEAVWANSHRPKNCPLMEV